MADDGTLSPADMAPGQDARLKTFLASALFVVPWFAWQAWVLGTSFGQRRGKLVADANAFAQTRVAQAALAAQRREAGEEAVEAPSRPGDASATAEAEHALPGRSRPLLLVLGIGLLFLFSRSWLARVLAVVPEAYLDEVFHIPQAQTYCAGRYLDWDDKITTPPGLYVVSLLLRPLWGGAVDGCSVWALRGANNVAIMLVAIVACSCRAALERQDQQRRRLCRHQSQSGRPLAPLPESIFSLHALHSAVNVALVPVLFFFSALYYTDVYATLSVLAAYRWYLFRQRDQYAPATEPGSPPQWTGLVTILLGFTALLFRQTNIFWVAVYLGGLEGVQAVKAVRQRNAQALQAEQATAATTTTLWAMAQRYARQYALGAIHDPPVGDAWPDDWLLCLLSIGIAAICNPGSILLRVWPYVTVLVGFAAFSVWNGGVVLGDKANHVATVHLAQLLYMWPLFAFFSAPLFVAHAVHDAKHVWARCVRGETEQVKEDQAAPRPSVTQAAFPSVAPGTTPKTTAAQNSFRFLHVVFVRKAYYGLYLVAVFGFMEAVVHYNTIVHPFTLADNRHYMFYVFRYTIRRGALLRYALVPVYAVCARACWRVLAGPGSNYGVAETQNTGDNRDFVNSPFVAFASIGDSHGAEVVAAEESAANSHLSNKKPSKKPAKTAKANKNDAATGGAGTDSNQAAAAALPAPPIFLSFLDEDNDAAASAAQTGAATSTALLWLLASALSLSMAPLVEPRYFILPWVFWRLLVPAVPTVPVAAPATTSTAGDGDSRRQTLLQRLGQKVDGRLVLETAWFVGVNVATMYVFLYWPYVWRDEDGHILDQGRLQRFLW